MADPHDPRFLNTLEAADAEGDIHPPRSLSELQQRLLLLERYRALYEALVKYFPNGGVHLFDHELRFIISDGQEIERLGLSHMQYLGRTLYEAFEPKVARLLEPHYRAALDGVASQFEFDYLDQTYMVYILPVYDRTQTLLAGMVMTQNITAMKQSEASLRESQALFAAIIANSPAAIFLKDTQGRYLLVNQAFCNTPGISLTPEQVRGRTARELGFSAEACAMIERNDQLVLNHKLAIQFENTITASGTEQKFSTVLFPIYDAEQDLIGLGGIATNTTALQQAELARQQTEQRYAAIINDDTDLVCRFNLDGRITFATQAFCNLFTRPRAMVLGTSIFDYIPNDQHQPLLAQIQAISPNKPSFEYDFIGTDVQYNLVWRRWRIKGIFDTAQQLMEYQCVGQDYSERLFIERQLTIQTQRAAALARAAVNLNTTINLADVLDLVAQELSAVLAIPIVIIYLYDPVQQVSHYAHSTGLTPEQIAVVRPIPFNLMRLRDDFKTGIQIFPNPLAETWMVNHPLHQVLGATRLITVELFRQYEFIGSFALISTDAAPDLDHEEQVLLRGIADLAVQAIANAQLFEAVQTLATRDALTGLYNRRYIIEQGAHALAALAAMQQVQPPSTMGQDDVYVGLIYLDLDRFKQINDTLGHDVGDVTLRQIAQELQQATPADAILGRMGGDEFAVLLPHTTKNHAASVARQILATVNQIYTIDNHQLTLGGSIGLVLEHNPEADFVQMLTSADIAMYRVKRSGGGIRLYDSELHNEVIRNVQLAHDLQRALEGDELLIYYQPIVNIAQQGVAMVEALLRWQHPTHGMLAPGVFLPVAEEHGLMQQLDLYVIERVLHEASQWWLAGRRVGVTINLSNSSIFRPDLPVWIRHALRDCHLPTQAVIFELSERTVLDDFADIQRTLNTLKQLGVRIALDDFGSGFGSLAYIQHLPLDMVKIDRDFTCTIGHEPRSETILRTMIGLSNSLHLLTVVEGVETEAQLNWLAEAGCAFVQGFLTGRPMPLAAVDWGQ